jgi:hypothetical protein
LKKQVMHASSLLLIGLLTAENWTSLEAADGAFLSEATSNRKHSEPRDARLDYLGFLLSSDGRVTLDGFVVFVGCTIQNGQTLTTEDSKATVDLGKNGVLIVGPHSSIFFTNTEDEARITCKSVTCKLKIAAGSVRVEGRSKKRLLRKGDSETLAYGDDAYFLGQAYIAINYDVNAAENKQSDRVGPGLTGILLLILVAATTGAGVATGGNEGQPASPIR